MSVLETYDNELCNKLDQICVRVAPRFSTGLPDDKIYEYLIRTASKVLPILKKHRQNQVSSRALNLLMGLFSVGCPSNHQVACSGCVLQSKSGGCFLVLTHSASALMTAEIIGFVGQLRNAANLSRTDKELKKRLKSKSSYKPTSYGQYLTGATFYWNSTTITNDNF